MHNGGDLSSPLKVFKGTLTKQNTLPREGMMVKGGYATSGSIGCPYLSTYAEDHGFYPWMNA